MLRVANPSAEPCNFFDRFGQKEQTGIGGRSKVACTSPSPGHQAQAYAGSPLRDIGGRLPWSEASPLKRGAFEPSHVGTAHHPVGGSAALSREDALLLVGVGPSSTYRTSDVLSSIGASGTAPNLGYHGDQAGRPQVHATNNKRRVVDFVGMNHFEEGQVSPQGIVGGRLFAQPLAPLVLPAGNGERGPSHQFLEEVDRLRQTNDGYGDSNVYGTPFHLIAAREAELRRRPSWDVDSFQSPSAAPLAPLQPKSALKIHDDGSGHNPQKKRAQLEPLATQEAVELQRQLQKLNRRNPSDAGSFQSTGSGQPSSARRDVTVLKELSPVRIRCSPQTRSMAPLPAHHPLQQLQQQDTTNLPGGMYGRPVPAIVADILAFHTRKRIEEDETRLPAKQKEFKKPGEVKSKKSHAHRSTGMPSRQS